MVTPRATARVFPAEEFGLQATLSERTPRSVRQPRSATPLSRHYTVAFLTPSGQIDGFECRAPATPVFEEAFAGFARGTLIATEHGPVAVEDLLPGLLIQTASNGLRPLLWVGSTKLAPTGGMAEDQAMRLTRLACESFGVGRPVPDLMLGPRARILYRSTRCREMLGSSQAFAPAHGFVDGEGVIDVKPFAPVRLFQLALHGQQSLLANGIEVESFHPGPQFETLMDRDTLDLFLGLFPYITEPDGFGPMQIPRLTAFELDTLRFG